VGGGGGFLGEGRKGFGAIRSEQELERKVGGVGRKTIGDAAVTLRWMEGSGYCLRG